SGRDYGREPRPEPLSSRDRCARISDRSCQPAKFQRLPGDQHQAAERDQGQDAQRQRRYRTAEHGWVVALVVLGADADPVAWVTLTNTWARRGTQTAQAYLSRPDSVVERPVRWLGGFARISARAGDAVTVDVRVPQRQFATGPPPITAGPTNLPISRSSPE